MKKGRIVLSWILVLTLILSLAPVAAFAAENEYEATNSYVLNYNGVYDGSKWQYFSPYWASWKYEGSSDYEALISFTLYNTATGEGFPTYCTDIDTGLDNNSYYRRINLEDSTYHVGNAAGVLRSVVLKGFPNTSVEALGAAAGVENLTVGEAVSATQLAVWQVTHGDRVEFTDFCYYIDTEWTPSHTAHYDECNAEIVNGYASEANEALIESHIQAVYAYLVGLAPTAPTGVAVSNASFVKWSDEPVVTENEDGTCNVTVSATVNVEMHGSDALTLTAVMGSYSASASLSNGTNTKTLTITNVPADVAMGDVTLAIDGLQTVSDVFLYDAVGERGSSQSLIGMDDSQLPVHAEITVEAERIVNFYKTTSGGTALEGIQFDIYYVADRTEYLSGAVDLPDATSYNYSGNPDYTVTTDSTGKGSFSLTKNNMPDGVYLVVEREHPTIVAPVSPFYVILPATSADGTHLEYEVNVHPKNEVRGGPEIEKDVIELENDEASVDAYAPHTWIISAEIPVDLANGKSYVISDTLDNRLDYVGNLKVQVETVDGSVVAATLTENVDYVLTVTDNNSLAEGTPSDSFTVALTGTGMVKVASLVSDPDDYMIRVYFDAQINANAEMGAEIPNQATLDYINSVGVGFEDKSDIPVVYTGAIQVRKVDANDQSVTLVGAEFQVYRPATAEEVADESITKVTLGEMATPMILVEFFDNAELTGEKVTTTVSDENGNVYIYGLAYGTYYLVETKAPAGYNLLEDPAELTISATSHLTEMTVIVENVSGTVLPETGGVGTGMFFHTGILLMLVAAALLILKKRQSA